MPTVRRRPSARTPRVMKPAPKSAKRARTTSGRRKKTPAKKNHVYEVDEVIGIMWNYQAKAISYLVVWKGYPITKATWEPEGNLVGSEHWTSKFDETYKYLSSRFVVDDYESEEEEDSDAKRFKQHWTVESLVGVQLNPAKNQIQCMVKWKGWDSAHNTWEPLGHLTHCDKRREQFESAIDALKKMRRRLPALRKGGNDMANIEDEEVDWNEEDEYLAKASEENVSTHSKPGPASSNSPKPAPKSIKERRNQEVLVKSESSTPTRRDDQDVSVIEENSPLSQTRRRSLRSSQATNDDIESIKSGTENHSSPKRPKPGPKSRRSL